MRNSLLIAGMLGLVACLSVGCAGPEKKFGRGVANVTEIVSGGEYQRGYEQGSLFYGPDVGATTGFVQGFDKTLARTGLGAFEIITFPIPPYGPIWTCYLTPNPANPDSYRPRKKAEPALSTDHYLGFSGGDVFPWFPGSRFRIFDN
jgi:putative exosortase-associated protein (TIGR04073 family)